VREAEMRFSEVFFVVPSDDDDWFDITLEVDNNFGVDPFLIYQDDSNEWKAAHSRILEFFAIVFDFVQRAKGDKEAYSKESLKKYRPMAALNDVR
jgi:hypothetical protein